MIFGIIIIIILLDEKSHYLIRGSSILVLLVTTQFEMLATLQCQQVLVLANGAFKTQNNLLCSLGLLTENGFCLTTITRLLAIITTLSLSKKGSLSGLVLGDLVRGVLSALLASAEGLASLGNVNLHGKIKR